MNNESFKPYPDDEVYLNLRLRPVSFNNGHCSYYIPKPDNEEI